MGNLNSWTIHRRTYCTNGPKLLLHLFLECQIQIAIMSWSCLSGLPDYGRSSTPFWFSKSCPNLKYHVWCKNIEMPLNAGNGPPSLQHTCIPLCACSLKFTQLGIIIWHRKIENGKLLLRPLRIKAHILTLNACAVLEIKCENTYYF